MAKLEALIKSEIVRFAKREVRKTIVPLRHNVRALKATLSQVRKSLIALERQAALAQKQIQKGGPQLQVSPGELKGSRLSPRLIQTLRKHLGISQKELAALAGVTTGAVHQWEAGNFRPTEAKKATLVGLRKLGRREVNELLKQADARKG